MIKRLFARYNYHWNASDTKHIWRSRTVTVCVPNSRRRCGRVWISSAGFRIKIITEMCLCRRCFISVWALWEIKISLCLWEESGRGGEGLSFLCAECVRVRRWHRFEQKSPDKNMTKGTNHEPTSASPDTLLWVGDISRPHLCRLHSAASLI